MCVTTTKAAYKNGVAVELDVEVAEPREEAKNKIVKNFQQLASPTVQEFKPRILIPKNTVNIRVEQRIMQKLKTIHVAMVRLMTSSFQNLQ